MKLLRLIQVMLTLFYGQLISIGLYENLLIGIPELIETSQSYFHISRVVLGVFIIFTAFFSLCVVWSKQFKLIFVSGLFLSCIFLTFIIVNTIYLTQNFEKLTKIEKEKLIPEVLLKSVSLVIAIFVTFFMASRGSYSLIQSTD